MSLDSRRSSIFAIKLTQFGLKELDHYEAINKYNKDYLINVKNEYNLLTNKIDSYDEQLKQSINAREKQISSCFKNFKKYIDLTDQQLKTLQLMVPQRESSKKESVMFDVSKKHKYQDLEEPLDYNKNLSDKMQEFKQKLQDQKAIIKEKTRIYDQKKQQIKNIAHDSIIQLDKNRSLTNSKLNLNETKPEPIANIYQLTQPPNLQKNNNQIKQLQLLSQSCQSKLIQAQNINDLFKNTLQKLFGIEVTLPAKRDLKQVHAGQLLYETLEQLSLKQVEIFRKQQKQDSPPKQNRMQMKKFMELDELEYIQIIKKNEQFLHQYFMALIDQKEYNLRKVFKRYKNIQVALKKIK